MPVDIAERKRRAIRGELSEVALALLTNRTFESLTIDEIAAAAGVSRRTFFRYFTSKEDVVFAFLDQWAVRLAADIVARPADEDPVAAVQTSFRQLTAAYDDRALALVRLVRETPSSSNKNGSIETTCDWRWSTHWPSAWVWTRSVICGLRSSLRSRSLPLTLRCSLGSETARARRLGICWTRRWGH